MAAKTLLFDEIPLPDEIEIEVEYSYYYHPGCYSGAPENCYPDEEEAEIIMPHHWEAAVICKYMAAARQAIKKIEAEVAEMEQDGTVRGWARAEKM